MDTTTSDGSVALGRDGALLGSVRLSGDQNYSTVLLPAVVSLLQGAGLSAAQVEAYAVTTGPGSFTGLRIGISTVQGLALASGRPCLGLSAFDVRMADHVGLAPCVVVLLEAYRDEVYAGVFDAAGRPTGDPSVEPLDAVLDRVPAGAAFVGDAVTRYRGTIEARRPHAMLRAESPPLAPTLLRLAAGRLAAGERPAAADVRPFYLREAAIRSPAR